MARSRLRETLRQRLVSTWPGAYWRYYEWKRGLAEPEMRLLPELCRKDEDAVDVGANLGLYTFGLSQHARSVNAFEPIPELAEQLRRGYRAKRDTVHIHECGLSDRSGSATLKLPVERRRFGYATIEAENDLTSKAELSGGVRSLSIAIKTLDEFELGQVGVVKIDVEGHDLAVLQGAKALIERCKPTFIIEVEERHKAGSVLGVERFLGERGYSAFFMREGKLQSFAGFDLTRNQDEARPADYIRNFVFLPPTHLERVGAFLS